MHLDFFVVMSNLISLFSVIAVGYIAARSGVVGENASAVFSSLLMKVTLPCTIFISLVQKDYDPAFIHDSLIIIAAGLVVFGGLMYLSRYVAILFRVPEGTRGVWAFAAAYTNSGFMGFPVALALLGPEGLALSVMLNIAFNVTIYTVGILEILRDNPGHEGEKINVKQIIFSNINIATVLSLIFYFGRIPLPKSIATPVTYISNITTPLSMMIIGIVLAHSHGREVFTDKHAWSCTFMSLIVYPVALCLLLKVFPLSSNPLVDAVLILIVAMPAASVTAVLCETYHGNIQFAAKVLFIQNLLSILTIPLICMLIS